MTAPALETLSFATTIIPQARQDFLVRIGGRNHYGRPNYRLVVAEQCYTKIAGEFSEWNPSIPVNERCGMKRVTVPLEKPEPIFAEVRGELKKVGMQYHREILVPTGHTPTRVWTGIKEVAVYPNFKGIILEHWRPAHCYGTPAAWNAIALADGTPVLGPYPEEGDYDSVVGPWNHIPDESLLDTAVGYVEQGIAARAAESLDTRIRKRINRAVREAEVASEKYQRMVFEVVKEKSDFLLKSSLAAGVLRNEYARAAGIKHHVGN